MPLPQPPAENVVELNEQLVIAQHELGAATVRLARVRDLMERGPAIGTGEQMRARVMFRVREVEVTAWAEEVQQLEQRARAMGLLR